MTAVRRFETPAGRQAQVDRGDFGTIDVDGVERRLWGFTFTLGYSRAMFAEAALDQKLGTLLRMHEEAYRQLGGVPHEILYDRMKTVWLKTGERSHVPTSEDEELAKRPVDRYTSRRFLYRRTRHRPRG